LQHWKKDSLALAFFERHFHSIETKKAYRVIIKLSESGTDEHKTELSSSVLKYHINFDFNSFESLGTLEKKKLLLNTLYEALIELCEIEDWTKDNFKNAYDSVIREEFVNIYTIKKKKSRDRQLSAMLIGDHNEKSFDCYLKVDDKNGLEVFNKLMFSETPDEFLFNGRIGDIKWLPNRVLVRTGKNKIEIERFDLLI